MGQTDRDETTTTTAMRPAGGDVNTHTTETPSERAMHHPAPTPIPEVEGRPRRETRKPLRYADYECYTLQSASDQSRNRETPSTRIGELITNQKIKKVNGQPEGMTETSTVIGGSTTNQKIKRIRNSKELVHYTVRREQRHQQETAPFCSEAKQRAQVDRSEGIDNYISDTLQNIKMDNKASTSGLNKEETELSGLLEEVAMLEGQLKTSEKTLIEDKPWWLREENLLGDTELDYSADIKPPTPKRESAATVPMEAKPAINIDKKESAATVPCETKPAINIDKKESLTVKPARIAMKEIKQVETTPQDRATGGATPSEGLPTGAGTGGEGEENVPPIREQRMGRCTIQMIRVPEGEQQPPRDNIDPVDQLWWVTPATEAAVRSLITGEDVTQQKCADCGFRGTRKRVRIHCLQHFCKYLCQCQLIKSSRDSIYDHQVAKGRSEEHGGVEGRIYCVDEATYPAFCEAMGWEDPPAFGEARPNRTGQPKKKAEATPSTKKDIRGRLGRQCKPATPEAGSPPPVTYRIPWTPEAMIQKTKECRQALGAELLVQITIVREALSQGRGGDPEQQCQLHAELEVMRQAYGRLSRE